MSAPKIRLLLVASLWLALAAAQSPHAATLTEGRAAPDFEVRLLDGRNLDLASVRGKVLMLHFWATWCPPCREEMPALERFYRERGKDGFELVAVSTDDPGDETKVRDFAGRFSYPVALLAASEIQDYGRIWRLPLSFLIDRKGVLRKVDWSGDARIDAASLARWVAPLLDEK